MAAKKLQPGYQCNYFLKQLMSQTRVIFNIKMHNKTIIVKAKVK